MYSTIKNLINLGNYKLDAIEWVIERHYCCGDLTKEQAVELLKLAEEHADDSKQIDFVAIIADLEQRVSKLESKGIVVWVAGMLTAKGQTVLYDIDKDKVLDYCRYDGGRASTSLSPGKINGWVKTDANGNVTHTIEKDENGNIILVPVEDDDVWQE